MPNVGTPTNLSRFYKPTQGNTANLGEAWLGPSVTTNGGATSVVLDITRAPVNEWVFAFIGLSDSQSANPTLPGWQELATGVETASGSNSSRLVVFMRRKEFGDTTFTCSWVVSCSVSAALVGYLGLDPQLPVESVVVTIHSSGTTFPTGTVTPKGINRKVVGAFLERGSTNIGAFTPPPEMKERVDITTTTNPWCILEVADTISTVGLTGVSYTATCSATSSHGSAIGFALVPSNTIVPPIGFVANPVHPGLGPTNARFFQTPQAMPAPVSSLGQTVSPDGITPNESFGNLSTSLSLTPSGVLSNENFGNPTVALNVVAIGAGTNEAFGSPVIQQVTSINPVGITTNEKFGNVRADLNLSPTAIPSEERFGNSQVNLNLTTVGIRSDEKFSSPVIQLVTTISPTGILTEGQFGNATVSPGPVTVSTIIGIAPEEKFGNPQVQPGAVTVAPVGVFSTETFGSPTVQQVTTISPTGITTNERFGNASVGLGISPVGASSNEKFGNPSIAAGTTTLSPTGIRSNEVFGASVVSIGAITQTINSIGIRSTIRFGSLTSVYRDATVNATYRANVNSTVAVPVLASSVQVPALEYDVSTVIDASFEDPLAF